MGCVYCSKPAAKCTLQVSKSPVAQCGCAVLVVCYLEVVFIQRSRAARMKFGVVSEVSSHIPRLSRLRSGEPGTVYHVRDVKGRREVDTT